MVRDNAVDDDEINMIFRQFFSHPALRRRSLKLFTFYRRRIWLGDQSRLKIADKDQSVAGRSRKGPRRPMASVRRMLVSFTQFFFIIVISAEDAVIRFGGDLDCGELFFKEAADERYQSVASDMHHSVINKL